MPRMRLNALWVGNKLGYIERLCLTSALRVGHPVTLYTYDTISNVPDGVDVRDGRDIMPFDRLIKYKSHNSYALGADIFRLLLMKYTEGCYIDCDLLFLKPMDEEDHIFGWDDAYINNAVLKLPTSSPVIDDILSLIASRPVIIPWWSHTRQLRQRLAWTVGKDEQPGALRYGTIGPHAVSYFVKKHGLTRLAKPVDVFYPNLYADAMDVFDPDCDLRQKITDRTVTVHLWNDKIKVCRNFMPLPGSFIFEQCQRLGISDPRWPSLLRTAVA